MAIYTSTSYAIKEMSVTNAPADYGNGEDNHMPIGLHGTWRYRGLLQFYCGHNYVPAGARLISATLKLKTTGQTFHAAKGSSVQLIIGILDSAFDASIGDGEIWKSSGGTTGFISMNNKVLQSNQGQHAHGTVYEYDVTSIFERLCQDDVLKSGGVNYCNEESNPGIGIKASVETSSNDTTEFWSSKGGYDPRVVFTYELEDPPDKPTNVTPDGDQTSIPTNVTFDTLAANTAVRYEASMWVQEYGESGGYFYYDSTFTPGGTTTIPISSFRDGRDENSPNIGDGTNAEVYISLFNSIDNEAMEESDFYVIPKPVTTVNHSAGDLLKINNLGEVAEWTGTGDEAAVNVSAYYTHPTGVASAYMEVEVGGSTEVIDPAVCADQETINLITTREMPRNSAENVRVRAYTNGVWGDWSSTVSCKVNWGQGVWRVADAAGAGDLTAQHGANAGGGDVVYLYKGDGSWSADLAAITPHGTNGVDILVRMSTDDSADAPSLQSFAIQYDTAGDALPDHWTSTTYADITLDANNRRFGVHSLLVETSDPYENITPSSAVKVSKNTIYTYSAYIKTEGVVTSTINLGYYNEAKTDYKFAYDFPEYNTPNNGYTNDTTGADEGWQRIWMTFDSGDNEAIWPFINTADSGVSWRVDSVQLEEGTIATQWKPGGMGAITLDAGGIAIDGAQGGTFRAKTGGGGTESLQYVIEMSDETLTTNRDRSIGDDARQLGTFWRGTWSGTDDYIRDDMVVNDGTVYICIEGHTTSYEPPNATYWDVLYEAPEPIVREYGYQASAYTWTKPDGILYADIEAFGAGGGGGGVLGSSTVRTAASGGGGGAWSKKMLTASELPSTLSITVGQGGSGGAAGQNNGSDGTDTTITGTGITTISVGAGEAGEGGGTSTGQYHNGGNPGSSSGGDINMRGTRGQSSVVISSRSMPAQGGSNGKGYPGGWQPDNWDGGQGYNFGTGGGGGANADTTSTVARAGGDGGDGRVIITEYYR